MESSASTMSNLPEFFVEMERTLGPEKLEQLKNMTERELIRAHFGLGMYLRNRYIYNNKSPLIRILQQSSTMPYEDSLSSFLIRVLWLHLNSVELDPASLGGEMVSSFLLIKDAETGELVDAPQDLDVLLLRLLGQAAE